MGGRELRTGSPRRHRERRRDSALRYARMGPRPGLPEQSVAQRAALRAADENVPQALSGCGPS